MPLVPPQTIPKPTDHFRTGSLQQTYKCTLSAQNRHSIQPWYSLMITSHSDSDTTHANYSHHYLHNRICRKFHAQNSIDSLRTYGVSLWKSMSQTWFLCNSLPLWRNYYCPSFVSFCASINTLVFYVICIAYLTVIMTSNHWFWK